MEGSGSLSGTPNDGKGDDNRVVDTLPVFYYEKMVGYTPSSFADLVFANERIEVGLKRGKSDHLALINAKTGANEEGENEGETHAL